MKYHLDTIPVWDAYHEDGEYTFILEYNTEQSYVSSFRRLCYGAGYWIQVNEKAFVPVTIPCYIMLKQAGTGP